jgi:DNA processing protein
MTDSLNSDDEAHWALIAQAIPELNIRLQQSLLASLSSFSTIFDTKDKTADASLNKQLQLVRKKYRRGQWKPLVSSIKATLAATGGQVIPITSSNYPQQLKEITRPPMLLYVRGDAQRLHLPQIAMVGSRRMTAGGDINARSWAKRLAQSGFTITSGLALGIDASSHWGALEPGMGNTIAVMATGIDQFYPSRNALLAEQILEAGGAVITEFAPGTQPRPEYFPQRNRIISGLSLGVLVVEAALNSGSLITAKYAIEQNREVFAIPGSINNPQTKGCHELIRQGATLVESIDEIAAELQGPLGALNEQVVIAEKPSILPKLSQDETVLLGLIGYDPVLIDNLYAPWPMDQLSQLLVSLELKGVITNDQGYFCRT